MPKSGLPAAKRPPARRPIAAIVRSRPLHVEVVDRLRDLIIEGEIEPGERLHEMNLSETLNVSRTPLREALKLLASEGLVDLLPGRGARVSVLSAGGAQDLFEVVSGLERLAAELAAVRMTSRDLARLKAMHDRMTEHFAAGEKREYFALNHAIHVAIVAAAKNDTLTGTHATLMSRARRGSYAALASEARWKESMTEHEELMEALERRDAKLAGDILFTHDRHTGETIGVLLAKAPHHQGRL